MLSKMFLCCASFPLEADRLDTARSLSTQPSTNALMERERGGPPPLVSLFSSSLSVLQSSTWSGITYICIVEYWKRFHLL